MDRFEAVRTNQSQGQTYEVVITLLDVGVDVDYERVLAPDRSITRSTCTSSSRPLVGWENYDLHAFYRSQWNGLQQIRSLDELGRGTMTTSVRLADQCFVSPVTLRSLTTSTDLLATSN